MTSSVIANAVTKKVNYSVDSFQPVAMYCFDPEVIGVTSTTPYKTLKDLVEASKKSAITLSTPGHSTSHHVAGVIMEQKFGAKFSYIHTKGASEAIPMVAGGHVVASLGTWSEFKPLVDQGKIRILGVASDKKDERIPAIPTFKEAGYSLVYGAWRGVSIAKGTPPEIASVLEKSFKKAIESASVKEKFKTNNIPLMYKDPKAFGDYIKADTTIQKDVLKKLAAEQTKK
jgi:tripartite-type tricarboxylate transporter receptor subunit TctC